MLNVVYLRVLLVMTSLLASERETGIFATSCRVLDVFLGVPILMVGAAFPILAHAGADDGARLAYALQRLAEASLVVSIALVLVIAIAAEPIVVILGGEQFRPSAGVLQLQCFVLIPAFLTQVWGFGLVSIHRQRSLVAMNLGALVTVLGLGALLIPTSEATGAAIAAVAGESVLAVTALLLLLRARSDLRPELGVPARAIAAAIPAALVALVPGLPAIAAALLALAIFVAIAWRAGAVPSELADAMPWRRRDAYASPP